MTSLALDPEPDCPKSVLGKAQLLLGAFGAGAFRLRLTELSQRSGVPKASAHRLAQELVQWGLLDRLEETGIARPTSRSAASPSELKLQLAEFRKKGYAVELEETLVGYGSVAVPVLGSAGEVYAAISATLPVNRLYVTRLAPQL